MKEKKELGKLLMTNRTRKIYQRMQRSSNMKKEKIKKLEAKRKLLEKKK